MCPRRSIEFADSVAYCEPTAGGHSMHDRRAFLRRLAATVAASAIEPAWGQERYPSRPITLVLPYAAGGGTDAIARVFAKALEERLGGALVVENRPGAAGNLATDAVAHAKADGYTLLIGNQGPMVHAPDRQPGADGGQPAPLQDHEIRSGADAGADHADRRCGAGRRGRSEPEGEDTGRAGGRGQAAAG